uniref:Uncharacterized protein n=1 Tax=Candidatus Kentrum sp. FW TaxID=2126338 RepID=A0A450SRW0_9GAMM|nr:MAG: hypothetical protein BECKFW1821A_GA0114235_106418 [Candidatus Kentron sp. FW]VFJ69905.1 MAG: hypothetical protein BECKFW1821B_GA0114236_11742 [Candidatus Kentron sp. FW]
MLIKKTLSILVICTFLLPGCVPGNKRSDFTRVGPPLSSSLSKPNVDEQGILRPKLDVVIPVFDPGLPEDPDDYERLGVWPELRRAEANRFAYKLKGALEKTGLFGAVRVTPDRSATGDLYVLGTIDKSNGEEVEIDLEVLDISGRVWLDETFEHKVKAYFYKNQRNKGKDPYEPVFDEAATEIMEKLKRHAAKDLDNLHYLADLRFGANFSDSAFVQYMDMEDGRIALTSKPSGDDPMLKRVKAIRIRDQLFVDGLQANYAMFSDRMNDSYSVWQKQSSLEVKAEREAKAKSRKEAVGGVLLIGLGILSAVAGGQSDSSLGGAAGAAGAVAGGLAGAALLQESFKTSKEAKLHRETLNELGESLDMELAPQVIKYEKETVKLTGDAKEQFAQWRAFLKKIYEQEATPDVQL